MQFLYDLYAWCPQRSEEDMKFPETGVMEDYEPLYG